MVLGIWNNSWLNRNSQISYPLTTWATKQDLSGTITLPDDFLVACYFPVNTALDVASERFYLQTLGIYPTGYTLGIGYDDGSPSGILVAVVNVPKSTHTENLSYAVAGVDDFDDCVGSVAIGVLDSVNLLPTGVYYFNRAGAAIEVDCIRPMIRSISSLRVISGQDVSERLYGDIELIAGDNFRIVASQATGANPTITLSAISGEGLNEQCVCTDETTSPCVRYFNGIAPLPDGNFRLIGNDCVQLAPIANGIQMSDSCSKPCCGCQELDALIKQIDRFADGVLTYQNFMNNLNAEVTQMGQVVLGSKLADQGCVDCG